MKSIEKIMGDGDWLDKVATPGPWRISDCHGLCVNTIDNNRMIVDLYPSSTDKGWQGKREDAEFIVAARTGWIETINYARKLERENEKLRNVVAVVALNEKEI